MNLFLVRARSPKRLMRFAAQWPPLLHRLASPPRSLLALASRLPASWKVTLLDLEAGPVEAAALRSCDAAILDREIGSSGTLRRLARRCVDAAAGLVVRGRRAGGAVLDWIASRNDGGRGGETPRWDLADPRGYPVLSVPVCDLQPDACRDEGALSFCFRTPDAVIEELESIAEAGWTQPIVLHTRGARWSASEATEVLDGLAGWTHPQGRRQLQAEIRIDELRDAALAERLLRAGVRDVSLLFPIGDEVSPSLQSETALVDELKRLQRAGFRIRSGVPVRESASTWDGFVRGAAQLRRAGLDRTLALLLGTRDALPRVGQTLAVAKSAGLSVGKLVSALRRSSRRMEADARGGFPLALAVAVFSELRVVVDGAS